MRRTFWRCDYRPRGTGQLRVRLCTARMNVHPVLHLHDISGTMSIRHTPHTATGTIWPPKTMQKAVALAHLRVAAWEPDDDDGSGRHPGASGVSSAAPAGALGLVGDARGSQPPAEPGAGRGEDRPAVCQGAADLLGTRVPLRRRRADHRGAGRQRGQARDPHGPAVRYRSGRPARAQAVPAAPDRRGDARGDRPEQRGARAQAASADGESGRGLQIVGALSYVWGWSPIEGNGKAVWAVLKSSAKPPDGDRGGPRPGGFARPGRYSCPVTSILLLVTGPRSCRSRTARARSG